MSAVNDSREDAASILSTALAPFGVTVHPTWPDNSVVAPAAIVIPGSPYIEHRDGNTFGQLTVNLRVVLIAPKSANSVQTELLDDLIEFALDALHQDFTVEQVEQPGSMTVGNSTYLATFIRISSPITLTS
jgi:hypothetical protein